MPKKILWYQVRFALPVWFFCFITSWLPDNRVSITLRGFLVSFFLPGRPKGFKLGRDVTLLGLDCLSISNNVYIAKGGWINALGGIIIGSEVKFGPYVVIVSTRHTIKDGSVYNGGTRFSPVEIGRGTWVSSHSTISSGVIVGSGCIIGANSVVTKDSGDNQFLAGVPAHKVSDILKDA